MDPFRILQSTQPTIRYQPRKYNTLTDALSKSRRQELTGSGVVVITEGNAAQKLVVNTRSPIVLTKEIQLWKEAQIEDPAIQATL